MKLKYLHHTSAGTKLSPRLRFEAVAVVGGGARFRRTFARRTEIAQTYREAGRRK